MRVTVVGSSPAWPNPGSAHAGYLVEASDRRLLVDCGPGVLARLREREPWPAVDAIAITHAHLDHCGDLVPWLWGRVMGPAQGGEPPALWLPPGAREALERLAGPGMLERGFAVHEYAAGGPFEAAGLRVEPVRLRHFTVAAFGLRIHGDGRTAAFTGDTGETDAVVDLARDADLLVIEATLADDDPDAGDGHLSGAQALAYAGRANARRVLLTHRPAELPAPEGAEVATDGLVVEL
ncbi:MAG TPA: MBL fold metallo-hydrolase [Gaiellaceae bacterium]|nr:MBL fold metallo-hydrolase [Gaiellaceae bacterium]